MEVDRILYIFGSFTRKKQDKRKSLEQLSLSAGSSPLHAKGSRRPVSQNLNVAPRTSAYSDGKKSKVKEWDCGICKKELVEPRLLGCLHNFCTRCLQALHQEGEAEVWSELDGVSRNAAPSLNQLEKLVSFLESKPWLAMGHARTANARIRSRQAWSEITTALNSDGSGCTKTSEQWCKYWKDKKGAVKRKSSLIAAARRRTGGGMEDLPELSEIELKIQTIMGGESFGCGDQNLEINPFEEEPLDRTVESEESPSILLNIVPPNEQQAEQSEVLIHESGHEMQWSNVAAFEGDSVQDNLAQIPTMSVPHQITEAAPDAHSSEAEENRVSFIEPTRLASQPNDVLERGSQSSVQLDPGGTRSGSGAGSAGSGYESDLRYSGSEGSWEQKHHKYGILTRKVSGKSVQFLLCPTCGFETQLPIGGIAALPLNYVLLRKMAAAQDSEGVHVLCDLCSSDNKAETRCNQCLVSICTSCEEAHGRQKATARHSLHPIDPAPVKYCTQHPKADLSVYCATCQQVICRDCCVVSHSGHALANASRAAAERARLLRDACERAKLVPDNVQIATRNLGAHAYEIDCQAARVESEVQEWAVQYRRAVEAHTRALCASAARARARHQHVLELKSRALRDRVTHAADAVSFAEELLAEGKEDEVLSLSGPVLRRLERLTELQPLSEPPRLELRFAPRAPATHDPTIFGRLLASAPDPDMCVVNTEGLQDLRVDCEHEVTLELRDSNGERIWCGGEQVAGYFRRRDSSARPSVSRVQEGADGSYSLSVTPRSPGAYLLAVTVNNKPIKGSPFSCCARSGAAHWGTYHCCAFCSSGGSTRPSCACGATMPGGYKGCGHGHAGWPGTRHWSCCGNTRRDSACTRPHRPRTQLYQFSL